MPMMLKGRFRFVYKKAEFRRHNVKAVIIALHICVLWGLIRVSHVGHSGWRDLILLKLTRVQEIGSALKNTKVGDTIRLEHAFTGDYVKSLILIAPTTDPPTECPRIVCQYNK